MNRVLVIDICLLCKHPSTHVHNNGWFAFCDHPKKKGVHVTEREVAHDGIRDDCPLPSSGYIVSEEDKEKITGDLIFAIRLP